MAFYKKTENTLEVAEYKICAPDYELCSSKFQEYTYPINGWWWFKTEEEAILKLGIEKIIEEKTET